MRIKDILSPESMIMELKATNKEDAIKARKEAEEKYFGEHSYSNSQKISEENNNDLS